LVAAADESRDELVDIWARLPAAAADPTRTKKFRQLFIEIAKQMDPIDAVVLQAIARQPQPKVHQERIDMPHTVSQELGLSNDEFEVSRSHLTKLGLFDLPPGLQQTSICREFLRAVND
jgi:hypothetical protein